MSVVAIPCEPAHLIAIERVEDTPDTREGFLLNPEAEEILYRYGRALLDDGKVIAVIGIIPKWESVGYAYAMLSRLAFQHPLSLTRETHRAIDYAEEELGMRRIEAAVSVQYPAGLRWIESLGFELEGRMRNYGPGGVGEYALYARCC